MAFNQSCVVESQKMVMEPLQFIVSAPGKIILYGEHSVVYGKRAIAASLDLRTHLAFMELPDHERMIKIKFHVNHISFQMKLDIDSLNEYFFTQPLPIIGKCSEFSWNQPQMIDISKFIPYVSNYVVKQFQPKMMPDFMQSFTSFLVIFVGIFKGINLPLNSILIDVSTQLKVGSGTGSSASYNVCIAGALIHYLRTRVARDGKLGKDISNVGYREAVFQICNLNEFSSEEKKLISQWAYLGECVMHGQPSGVDNSVITQGAMIEFVSAAAEGGSRMKELNCNQITILLVNSGVQRNTRIMIDKVQRLLQKYPMVVNSIFDAMDHIVGAAKVILEDESVFGSNSNDIVGPDEKLANQYSRLGELVELNQHLLSSLGVSHPCLDEITTTISKYGFQGKLTGSGGGGYAFMLVPPNSPQSKLSDLQEELTRRGFECVVTSLGIKGISIDKN